MNFGAISGNFRQFPARSITGLSVDGNNKIVIFNQLVSQSEGAVRQCRLRYEKPDRVSVRPCTPFYGSDTTAVQYYKLIECINSLFICVMHICVKSSFLISSSAPYSI